MDFIELIRTDDIENKSITLSVTVSGAVIHNELEDFYSVVNRYVDNVASGDWAAIDATLAESMTKEHYNELRRDFVINKIGSAALSKLSIKPALTPSIRVLEYPDPGNDYSFELSVVEKPELSLSSYDPVEIEVEDIEVTDELIDARIQELLECHASYERVDGHPVVYGDIVRLDIATVHNGKTVPHLTGKKMIFQLSDDSMPTDFVAQLIGTAIGKTKTITYAQKKARAIVDADVDVYTSTVTVLEQLKKKVPLLTDEWVSDNIEHASSVKDLRDQIFHNLEYEVAVINRDTHARLANIEIEKRLKGEIPDAFYQASKNGLMGKLERELSEKGETLDDYCENEEINEEELSIQMLIKSGENLRQGFALEALFDGNSMTLTEDDLIQSCEQAFGNGSYDKEELKRTGKFEIVESSAKRMAALNWLADTAIIKGN